jgi:hypothetical protein
VPAARSTGLAIAGNHGYSQTGHHDSRKSRNRQVVALQRHRPPKLIVRVLSLIAGAWDICGMQHGHRSAPRALPQVMVHSPTSAVAV